MPKNKKPEEKAYGVRVPIEVARVLDKQVKPHGPYSSPAEFIRSAIRKKLKEDGLL